MIKHQCNETEPLLSGYLDGELTQGDRQRVELILDDCETCRKGFEELQQVRRHVGAINYRKMTESEKQEASKAVGATSANVGLGIFFLGVVTVYGTGILYLLRELIIDSEAPWFIRLGVPAVLIGLGIAFATVLYQRLQAAKTDKYKNVRI